MATQSETLRTAERAATAPSPAREEKFAASFCLIVDDEKSIRTLIARALRPLMVMTEECGDAQSALSAIKHRTPDFIFLDVSLERSDAVEVIRGLGENQFAGCIQLMSGRDLPLLENIKRVGERYSLNMLPVLQKPFRIDVLTQIVRDAGIGGSSGDGPKLFEALCAGSIELHYQPVVDLSTMQLAGAEGLARINHPDHGIMMPGAFLPNADPASMLSLGEYSIEAALRDWCDFADAGAALRLSINVPLHALTKLPIAAIVRENRPKSPHWPGIVLEIGEDQILRDIPLVYEIATQLSIYDIHLAVDRFGYALSSITKLMELPNVELKLDRKFVAGCTQDPVKMQLCQSVIALAHKYKRRVVAVGIDQTSDLRALTAMGCDLGQGMLLGPPLPKTKIRQMIRSLAGRNAGK